MLVALDPIAFRVWPAGCVFETYTDLNSYCCSQVFAEFLSNMNTKAILLGEKCGTDLVKLIKLIKL